MNKPSQAEKAQTLLSLHSSGEMLILPNIWNPIGARILEKEGYPAVATASAALSASLGYADGERIERSTLIHFIGRIARSVDVPVTADIETGYGQSISELSETIFQVTDSGVVGINLEDSAGEGHALRPIDQQCDRIAAARNVAQKRQLHLVINARVDSFLAPTSQDKSRAIDDAATRAKAYVEAGADCIYPIGPGDEPTVRMLRERIEEKINILASPAAAPLQTLRAIGVNRVSFGPFVFRSCLKQLLGIVQGVRNRDEVRWLSEAMTAAQTRPYLREEQEQ